MRRRGFFPFLYEVDEPPAPARNRATSEKKRGAMGKTDEKKKKETHHARSPRGLVGVLPVKGASVIGQDPRAPAGEARRGLGERGRDEE